MPHTLTAVLAAALFGGSLMAITPPPALPHRDFGQLPDGRHAELYTLDNHRGLRAEITNYGGIVVSLQTPDRRGKSGDIVLGYDNLAGYVGDTKTYFGALIGRYANRIAHGRFSLDGHTYHLAANNGANSLHGGNVGFNRRLWTARDVSTAAAPALELSYHSADGEEGYPGALSVRVVYTVTPDNTLRIEYAATTDKDTVLNLTNHSYFNLNGEGAGDILPTVLTLHARRFTPVDATLIPDGKLAPVAGTPLDFTQPTPIGARIAQPDAQLKFAGGYDFNYVLDAGQPRQPALAAEAYDPRSGRVMRVLTTQPGIQLYSGNFLDGSVIGKHGHHYGLHAGFALETQHFPDSPNQPRFPSTELKPGQRFHSVTEYRFSTRN